MEKNNITLSIIVPVYNTPIEYIKECLKSISNAKIEYPYEIIIINDGSTNSKVVEFLDQYKEEHTLVIHKNNGGLSSARNAGLSVAQGNLILPLDSDDLLLPEINKAISFLLNNHSYHIVFCDVQAFDEANYKNTKGRFSKFKQIYIGNLVSAISLYRKEILSKINHYNENLKWAEDWDFWSRAASAGFRFKYLPQPFFLYRRVYNGASISQSHYEIREDTKSFIKSQFNPHKEITLEEVNKYVLNNFKDNKKHLIKLFLILFLLPAFKFLHKKGVYKNNIVID